MTKKQIKKAFKYLEKMNSNKMFILLFTSRIRNFFVILSGFKIGQRRTASGGERHHFDTSIDQSLVENLFENPPN